MCVTDLSKDPTEHHDLSASLPAVKAQLMSALKTATKTTYQTNETPGYTQCRNASAVVAENHGFVGMVCSAGGGHN